MSTELLSPSRFREMREEADITLEALSEEIDVPVSSISHFEHGNMDIDKKSLEEAKDLMEERIERRKKLYVNRKDDIFHSISSKRRRVALLIMKDVGDVISLSDLSDMVAAIENKKSVVQVTSDERKRVYIGFLQNNMEPLENQDLVRFEEGRKFIYRTEITEPFAEALAEWMETLEPHILRETNRVIEEYRDETLSASSVLHPAFYRVPTPEEFTELREQAGLTQRHIAYKVDITPTTLSKFENGETRMNSGDLRKCLDVIRNQT